MKKKLETLKSLRLQLKWIRESARVDRERMYAKGYNNGRQDVTNKFRELLGIDLL